MKRFAIIAMAIFAVITLTTGALAAGTGAGSTISNTASASYSIGTIPGYTATSNTDTITVDEIINVVVEHQDSNNIPVEMGDTQAITTFKITNTGNGTENFDLTAASDIALLLDGVTPDNFNPSFNFIYVETNSTNSWQSDDTVYNATNYPDGISIAADGEVIVYLLNDIPSSGLSETNIGLTRLTATSETFGSTGTAGLHSNGGGSDGATDAVAGSTAGIGVDEWFYEITSVQVHINKTHSINDGYSGTSAIPGATITYSLLVTTSGTSYADNVVISDTLDTSLVTYIPGSLKLNGGAPGGVDFTDLSTDSDGGSYNAGVITITFSQITGLSSFNSGDVAIGPQTITFQATIK